MYKYSDERPKVLEPDFQKQFINGRDEVLSILAKSGAITMGVAMAQFGSGDTWHHMACVDRMVEIDDLREVTQAEHPIGQHRVFMRKGGS